MSFKSKKLLLILELNQSLLYINNSQNKYVDLTKQNNQIHYHDSYEQYQINYRKGRHQFIQYIMHTEKNSIDIAIWSNLSHLLTENITRKYFGRFYRNLLFVLATNRLLYNQKNLESDIAIRRDLQNIYNRFIGYNENNTLMISSKANLIQIYRRNDLIIPHYTPSSGNFNADAGMYPLMKYIKGLIVLQKQGNVEDIRRITHGKQISKMFERYAHTMYTQTQYL